MKVLIPLLGREEVGEAFVEEAARKAKEVVLLLVIDTNLMPNQFGFAASEIRQGNILMEEMGKILGRKRKRCEELVEWGDTCSKIIQTAKLKEADAIALKKQENQYFEGLVKRLEREWKKELRVVEEKPLEEGAEEAIE